MAMITPMRLNTTPLTKSFYESQPIFLHEWWLVKPQNHCNGFALAGYASMPREKIFVSSLIVKRHEPNVLETEDGIIVIFRGMINSSRTFQNGFSSEVCQRFLVGFPYDWKFFCDYMDRVTDFDVSNTSSHKATTASQEAMEVEGDKKLSHPQVEEAYNGEIRVSDFDDSNASCHKKTADLTSHQIKEAADDNSVGSLKMSQLQVDMINNGENGVSSVSAAESSQSKMSVFDFDPVLEQSSSFKSPLHLKKLKFCQLSRDIKQKIVEDPGNLRRRVVTRSIAKRMGESK